MATPTASQEVLRLIQKIRQAHDDIKAAKEERASSPHTARLQRAGAEACVSGLLNYALLWRLVLLTDPSPLTIEESDEIDDYFPVFATYLYGELRDETPPGIVSDVLAFARGWSLRTV